MILPLAFATQQEHPSVMLLQTIFKGFLQIIIFCAGIMDKGVPACLQLLWRQRVSVASDDDLCFRCYPMLQEGIIGSVTADDDLCFLQERQRWGKRGEVSIGDDDYRIRGEHLAEERV